MHWQQICEDPMLRNLPYKIETNRWGKIEMSPASNKHGFLQVMIVEWLLRLLPEGRPLTKCTIQTTEGVKVGDVAWASNDFLRRYGVANPYPESPEIVVEILSPSNTLAEMEEKKELYFARGAREVWLSQEDGVMRFYNNHARLEASEYASAFPVRLELPFA